MSNRPNGEMTDNAAEQGRLSVLQINLFDYQGGAARIGWMLMESLTSHGHDGRIFAHRPSQRDSRIIPITFPNTSWQKSLQDKEKAAGLFDFHSAALFGVISHPFFQQADVVHIHCINGNYFSNLLLPFLAAKPIVWTLHDPLAFTAGCLYPDSCLHWRDNGCTECPLTGPGNIKRQTGLLQSLKSDIYKLADFTVVCPSQWLLERAKQSILGQKDIRLIANGIDANVFRPNDRMQMRDKLGLPKDKKIIMFAAHGGFNNRPKGGHLLLEALKKLDRKDVVLLNIGGHDNRALQGIDLAHIDLPYIDNQQRLAECYAAADLFVSPSMAENLSLVICEAMACGTPVVAFRVGGNPEIIDHGSNGYVARAFDPRDLAAGIALLLDNETIRVQAGHLARQKIVNQFNVARMADEYIQLYREVSRK